MDLAVQLDHNAFCRAVEIDHIAVDGLLAAEFPAIELTSFESAPEPGFSRGEAGAKCPAEGFEAFAVEEGVAYGKSFVLFRFMNPSVLRTAPPTPQSFGQLPLEKGSSKRSGFVAYGEELTGHAAVPVQARKTRESDVHRYDCGCDPVMSQDLHPARLGSTSSRAPTCPASGSPPFQGGAGVVSCLPLWGR